MQRLMDDLGLSERELAIFRTLNDCGELTSSSLVKKTKIPSSKIYYMLDKMVALGLLVYHFRGKIRIYRANDPTILTDAFTKRKEELMQEENSLAQLVMELAKTRNSSQRYLDIAVFEGVHGIMAFHDTLLRSSRRGQTILLISSSMSSVTLRSYFRHFHERRVKKGIRYKIIKSAEAERFVEAFPLTESRYASKKQAMPTGTIIAGDVVGILIYNVQPTLIRIANAELAASFRKYFQSLWQECRAAA